MQLCFAPMDWITNCATRLITKNIFEKYWKKEDSLNLRTEFMNVDGFLINPHQVIKHALTTPWQKPILQIYGWKGETLIKAAEKIQNEYSDLFSWIELNTWCPSNTVMKVGWWSDMLKDKEKTLNIISELSEIQGPLPFSLKTRAWLNDSDKESQKNFIRKASKYCSKISIHGRTLKQLYTWMADRDFIAEIKKDINENWNSECKIIGNGWIISYDDAENKLSEFNLDWIMVGQAAIWNPRIFTPYEPTLEEKCETILNHLDYSIACDQRFDEKIASKSWDITVEDLNIPLEWLDDRIKGNQKKSDLQPHTIVEFRKFLFQYVKWIPWSKERKQQVLTCKDYQELKNQIIDFFSSHSE
jgi:tRNA-dihydrouridine synthase